jgi:hypothetical protein
LADFAFVLHRALCAHHEATNHAHVEIQVRALEFWETNVQRKRLQMIDVLRITAYAGGQPIPTRSRGLQLWKQKEHNSSRLNFQLWAHIISGCACILYNTTVKARKYTAV